MIVFKGQVKSVTANVAKKTVHVSFVFSMNDDDAMELADGLAFHVDKGAVMVIVKPSQMRLSLGDAEMSVKKKKKGGGG